VLRRAVPRDDEFYTRSGNLLLDGVLGAQVSLVDTTDEADAAMAAIAERTGAYVVPLGGSDAVGALGYVDAGLELAEQLAAAGVDPAAVVCAASSCGTAAGLAIAMAATGGPPVVAVAVSDDGATISSSATTLIEQTAATLGIEPPGGPVVVDEHIGPAYGIPTDEGTSSIETLARTEGVLLDPVYTAKAFAHVLAGAHAGDFHGDVVFVHTGGSPGLFAYTPLFAASKSASVRSGS
jgi:1-aminocyclopropane-1-carboxylate deaminase/D-cysteine desulfhydrase-like pyridoxal-dependent ACC family enzyme